VKREKREKRGKKNHHIKREDAFFGIENKKPRKKQGPSGSPIS